MIECEDFKMLKEWSGAVSTSLRDKGVLVLSHTGTDKNTPASNCFIKF